MRRQQDWEGWFLKRHVSQKQQDREDHLGMAYCIFSVPQRWAPGLARLGVHPNAHRSVSRKALGCCAH